MKRQQTPVIAGFEKAEEYQFLFDEFGFTQNLGLFFHEHLLEVLRRQYSDLEIESIELVDVSNHQIGGMQTEDPRGSFKTSFC